MEDFTQAQLMRRSRAAGGLRGIAKLERERPAAKHTYLLKGLVRCDICARRMQGAVIRKGIYYRCIARTMAPGSPVLADHPKTVNLREDVVIPPLNAWLCQVFDPDNRDETVAAMVGAQPGGSGTGRETVEKRLKDAEARLRRHQAAIEAGVDPAALVDAMNLAQAERQAAREELENLPESATIDAAEVYAMLDSLGVERALNSRNPDRITQVYRDLGLQVLYDNKKEAVVVTASPRVDNVCVRGGT
ncbi:zinc ribbon domain-containing protein [Amycolatopsis sp. WAC 04169]|uniref:zinc ribbon domain-containing protein n=1 Tax=Amycolatopsis sp. WAC 04169 TaxID=2203197 RepID=UPI001F357F8F|nr:zinc ribbon domain-containing protein [Amycolatopsis sp. WAC 04169]